MFSAYNFESEESILPLPGSPGRCVTSQYNSSLAIPFTVTQGASVNNKDFSASAISSFISFLGFNGCPNGQNSEGTVLAQVSNLTVFSTMPVSGNVTDPLNVFQTNAILTDLTRTLPLNTVNVIMHTSLPTSTSPLTSVNIATPTYPPIRPELSIRTKIGLGVGVPIAAIATLTCVVLAISHYRKSKRNKHPDLSPTSSEGEEQPYLQQKGELDAEERRRFELEAGRRQYELDGDNNEIHEMPSAFDGQLSHQRRQELRGEEHCKEMSG